MRSCLIFLFLTLVAVVCGQTEVSPNRSSEIRFFIRGRGHFDDLLYRASPSKVAPLSLARGRRSVVHDYIGPDAFQLLREDGIDELGRPRYRVVSVTDLPLSPEVLALLIPNPSWDEGQTDIPEFLCFAVDDRNSSIPWNKLTFLNLTGAEMAGVIGNEQIRLGAGLSEPIDLEPYFGKKDILVGLTVRYLDSQRIVLESRQRFEPDVRLLYVLLPPERAGSLDIGAFKIVDQSNPERTPDSR